MEDYLKAQSEGKDAQVDADAGVPEFRRGARVVATAAPAEVIVPSADAWQPDAEKSKKTAFGQ